ncbi:MAG: hypothetical protein ACYC4T_09975 [Melioribacteraceae bacterium]
MLTFSKSRQTLFFILLLFSTVYSFNGNPERAKLGMVVTASDLATSAGVPRTVAGLIYTLQKYGTMKLLEGILIDLSTKTFFGTSDPRGLAGW